MHYYQFNIADYRKKTGHLTLVEHAIYRALLDTYYLQELPLPKDTSKLMRSHSVRTADEREAFANVLADFFVERPDGYHHEKCDKELEEIYCKSNKARDSANARWDRYRKELELDKSGHANASPDDANAYEDNANAKRTECEGNAKAMLPNTQYPTPSENPLSESGDSDGEKAKKRKVARDKQLERTAPYITTVERMWLRIQPLTGQETTPNLISWADDVRKLVEIDHRELELVHRVFAWANSDDFWRNNIQSPAKLRKQFGMLFARMNQEATNGQDRQTAGQAKHPGRLSAVDRVKQSRFGVNA